MRKIIVWLMAFLVIMAPMAVTACGGSGDRNSITAPVQNTSVSGTWEALVPIELSDGTYAQVPLILNLQDATGGFNGYGTFGTGSGAFAVTVTGTIANGYVGMTIHENSAVADAMFTGTTTSYSGEIRAMLGSLNGSGFVNTPTTFERQ